MKSEGDTVPGMEEVPCILWPYDWFREWPYDWFREWPIADHTAADLFLNMASELQIYE